MRQDGFKVVLSSRSEGQGIGRRRKYEKKTWSSAAACTPCRRHAAHSALAKPKRQRLDPNRRYSAMEVHAARILRLSLLVAISMPRSYPACGKCGSFYVVACTVQYFAFAKVCRIQLQIVYLGRRRREDRGDQIFRWRKTELISQASFFLLSLTSPAHVFNANETRYETSQIRRTEQD